MLEVLEIEDNWQRLMYAVIFSAFQDFYYYPHRPEIRMPAYEFLMNGGWDYKEFTPMNVKRVFLKYCKDEYGWTEEEVESYGRNTKDTV